MKEKQRTLQRSGRISGIALHTGVRAYLTLKPAAADSGITISRVDLPNSPCAQALASNVVDVQRATTIAVGEGKVHTVEHVLAALYALGIDNALLELDGPEPPVADGSSAPYVDLVRSLGVEEQAAERRYWHVREPIYYEAGETRMVLLPYHEYRISCTVQYGASLLDTQYLSLAVDEDSFVEDLSRARTFCTYAEIEPLMKADLIRGGSLDNAVVIKDGAIICKDGLRYPDELVRHKMLDIVGDLSLIGRRLVGQVIAIKPGHQANVELGQKVLEAMADA